jgi:hypothetical protein
MNCHCFAIWLWSQKIMYCPWHGGIWKSHEMWFSNISFVARQILGNLKGILFAMCRIVEVSPLMVGVMASQAIYFFNDPWDHDIFLSHISRYLHLFQLIAFASHFWVLNFDKGYQHI